MSPNPRQQREQAEVKQRIVAAARDMFVEHGFESVSLRKIAEAIGYTAPALYTHFRDKGEILAEICRQDFASLAVVFNRLAKVDDPVLRIFKIGMTYIRFAREHPNHYRLMFMTPELALLAEPTPEDLASMNDPDQDAYAFLKQAVEQSIKLGKMRPELTDAELLTQTLWAGVHGVASLEITHAECPWLERVSLERRSRLVCVSMLRGLMRDPLALAEDAS